MKRTLVVLVVLALSAGTGRAAVSWDILDDDFGSNQDGSAVSDLGWWMPSFSSETLASDYTSFQWYGGHTKNLVPPLDNLAPATYTVEMRIRFLTNWIGNEFETQGVGAVPASESQLEWMADGSVTVRETVDATEDVSDTGLHAQGEWHTYTYVSSVGSGTDYWKLWVDDLTMSGAPDAEVSGTIAGQPGTAGTGQMWFNAPYPGDFAYADFDYFRMSSTIGAVVTGDVDKDGLVGGKDVTLLLSNWGMTGAVRTDGDLSGDGTVDGTDWTVVLSNWGQTNAPPEPPAVPEPTTLLILAGAALAGFVRRR